MPRESANIVDLRSDTVTRPDAGMREAIATAEVGDHTLGDDPTAAELERYVAEILGKEAALFFPSGIMANQTAIAVQARPGSEVVVDAGAHIVHYEEAAAAALSGAQLRVVESIDGVPDADAFAAAMQRPSRFQPACHLVCLENTHNGAGGRILPLATMAAIRQAARELGVKVHLDGARLANAAVATGRDMREWADLADTVMISLSKGLGAPVGSMLAGTEVAMAEAWRVRRRLGGGLRQAGILAAAGLYALRNNLARLADDHRRAAALARSLGRLPGLKVDEPETNIVMIDLDRSLGPARGAVAYCEARGVRMVEFGPSRLRAVLHRDVDDAGIEAAVGAFEEFYGR